MRRVVWFSCGAASAVTAKLAMEKYGDVEVVYCDLKKDEHPDNARFLADVERWIGKRVTIIRSEKFGGIEEVFDRAKYMSGIHGAPCTVEMKKIPRFNYQLPDDLHLFGYTSEERGRIARFEANNPELNLEWILRDNSITKAKCFDIVRRAGIELPEMYKRGFKNNNCIGCVKATSPAYWQKVREVSPETFVSRAEQSRRLGVRLCRLRGKRIFLDELPPDDYKQYELENISCGPECGVTP